MPFEARILRRRIMRSRAGSKWKAKFMYYVYLLRSLKNPTKTYIGYTTNIEQRLETHNSGGSIYTKQDKPWKIVTYIAFDCEVKAIEFEKYIKVGSGYVLAKKRFW